MQLLLFAAKLLEGFSAIAGVYYLRKNPNDLSNRLLMYFLLITFFVEIIGLIPTIIYYHESLHYLKDTVWYTNFWLYNPYLIVSYTFYMFYFSQNLKSGVLKRFINYSILVFVILSSLILVFSDILFVSHSYFILFVGVALLFLSISFYYYELLQDEKLLEIKKSVKFYVSVSFLLFNLISLPLWIYFKYYSNSLSPEFVQLYQLIFYFSNVLLYSTYIFAFLYCAKVMSNSSLKAASK